VKAVIPSRADVVVRQHIIDVLSDRIPLALARFGQRCIISSCGSCLSGTCLPESDIDLAIYVYPIPSSVVRMMAHLRQELSDLARPDSFLAVPNARVPLLKFFVDPGIQVDLSIDELQGPLSVQSIRHLFASFPVLLPTQVFLKCLLRKHHLDQPYTGGISSYALFLMALAYLQHAGEQPFIVDFVRGLCAFYGTEFNFALTGIDVSGDGKFFCRAAEQRLCLKSPTTMCILDPFNHRSGLGENSFRMEDVRAVLRNMRDVIDSGSTERWAEEFQEVVKGAAVRQGVIDEDARMNEIG
jgi:non-canonical poly(A) RNA polymerase PAPD5/7